MTNAEKAEQLSTNSKRENRYSGIDPSAVTNLNKETTQGRQVYQNCGSSRTFLLQENHRKATAIRRAGTQNEKKKKKKI